MKNLLWAIIGTLSAAIIVLLLAGCGGGGLDGWGEMPDEFPHTIEEIREWGDPYWCLSPVHQAMIPCESDPENG
jgi:hypothetical protein